MTVIIVTIYVSQQTQTKNFKSNIEFFTYLILYITLYFV